MKRGVGGQRTAGPSEPAEAADLYMAAPRARAAGSLPGMPASELSASNQEYLKTIWTLGEWDDGPVTPSRLAERIGVRLSSASDAVRRLAASGLVEHVPYGAVALTAEGRKAALILVRRHRLLETFLAKVLGYSWDEVHAEADALEHVVSELMVERIDKLLGRPERDPHGDPIPTADGVVAAPRHIALEALPIGRRGRLERVLDADPDLLRHLDSAGLRLDDEVELLPSAPFAERVTLRFGGDGRTVRVRRSQCRFLRISVPTRPGPDV